MSVLLVTESSTDRTAWKKLFIELGVPVGNFQNTSSFDEAISIISNNNIGIVVSSYIVAQMATFPLVQAHIEKCPDRSDYFFFMVSEKNSLAVAAESVEYEIDGLLIKPYNQLDLTEAVADALLDGSNLSKDIRQYNEILGEIRSNNIEQAEAKAEKYILNKPQSPNGYYLRGLTKKTAGDLEEALGIWKMGLNKDKKHHKLLCNIFDTYTEIGDYKNSYKYAEVLTTEHPVNPMRIPNFIRASLASENYHNLIQFCETITSVEADFAAINKPIAAALALAGKSLLYNADQDCRDLIIKTSRKAISLSEQQSRIFVASLQNLFNLGKYEIVEDYINQVPSDELNLELVGLELQIIKLSAGADKAFVKAQNLIKLNKVSPDIYKVLLESAKEIGKSSSQIQDMLYDGVKLYPDLKGELETIVLS
ncbi:MAG: hypothetical protein HON90_04150 [Halobacteriovoraceae bacterium]|nr:hypothetical protein [Halobacteriovoraceae bacterium]